MNTPENENPWDELKKAMVLRDTIIQDKKQLKAFERTAIKKVEELKKELANDLQKITNTDDFYAWVITDQEPGKLDVSQFNKRVQEECNEYMKGIVTRIHNSTL